MPTIALVDDDRNILTSVSIALEAEGYRIMTYTDGASALDGLKQNPPDLAIFDIKMPRMDGMELLRRLRQKSDIPVIFLTSKDEEIDELFGLKMGADDFITKPFSQRLLVERVKAILRRASSREAAASAGGAAGTPAKVGEIAARSLERGQLGVDQLLPALDHDEPAGDALDVGHVMGGEQDGRAVLGQELDGELEKFPACDRIEPARRMRLNKLQQIAVNALEDIKARDIKVLDVRKLTSFYDTLIIASAESYS